MLASNLKNGLSSYLYMQLNELIHFLLELPMNINTKVNEATGFFFEKQAKEDLQNINLIFFRVFDLIRCKCTSGEEEIIYLINHLKNKEENVNALSTSSLTASTKGPQMKKVELVRVKDRLGEGSRDILVNAKFN